MIFIQFASEQLGVEVVKEHLFDPSRKWRFDYAIVDYKIALEVEGGVYTGGRHVRAVGFLKDLEKYNAASAQGWRVLRCTPSTLLTNATIKLLQQAMRATMSSVDVGALEERHRLTCPFLHAKNICKDAASGIRRPCDGGCEFMTSFKLRSHYEATGKEA